MFSLRSIFKYCFFVFGLLFLFSTIFVYPTISAFIYDIIIYKMIFFYLSFTCFFSSFLFSKIFCKFKFSKQILKSILCFFLCIVFSTLTFSFHSDEYFSYIENKQDFSSISDNYFSYDTELKVHYIDVGQGDSIFIEFPNQKTMLIDAGEEAYAKVVSNYISNLGYSSIDYVIASHPHSDHIGGLAYILEQFPVHSIYMPSAITTTRTYERLLETMIEKGLKAKRAKAGVSIIEEDALLVQFVAPNQDFYSNLNNYSAVLWIQYGNRKFLFMGDAELEVEQEITTPIQADVVKVGHHGSITSSSESFIEQVDASYAIISVGVDNTYQHPHASVVERWMNSGASIYRTDLHGTTIVSTDGNDLIVETSKFSTTYDTHSPIHLVSLTQTVQRGDMAHITIQGLPNTSYHISVLYTSGNSSANGLEVHESDNDGMVSWSWKIGSKVKNGNYTIIVSDGEHEENFKFQVMGG